jgi:dihydrofolate synthase/folylpolyglutamate synthase
VSCLVGPQTAAAQGVIEERAAALGVPLTVHGRDWQAWSERERLQVVVGARRLELPLPVLPGRHQIDNAGLAVACALALGDLAPGEDAIAAGLRTARWPARLQRLAGGPLVDLLPAGWQLWLDGGHNPAAGEALAASLDAARPAPWHLVVGMLNTKDEAGFLRPLAPLVRSITTVPVPNEPASRAPAEAARLVAELGFEARPAANVADALAGIVAREAGAARVLICGSLYLAGHVLRSNA